MSDTPFEDAANRALPHAPPRANHWNAFQRMWNVNMRPLEVGLGAIIFLPNFWIMLPFYDSMSFKAYETHLKIMPEWVWGSLGVLAALFIWAGVYINGMMRSSPKLRMAGMVLSFGIHCSLTVTWFMSTGPDGIAWVVYLGCALIAFYCLLNLAAHLECEKSE